jgi:hypothetical protein
LWLRGAGGVKPLFGHGETENKIPPEAAGEGGDPLLRVFVIALQRRDPELRLVPPGTHRLSLFCPFD